VSFPSPDRATWGLSRVVLARIIFLLQRPPLQIISNLERQADKECYDNGREEDQEAKPVELNKPKRPIGLQALAIAHHINGSSQHIREAAQRRHATPDIQTPIRSHLGER
jgi:hypothetical protein